MVEASTDELYRCNFSEPTIAVLVGPQETSFQLHPTILTNNSRFFRAMLAHQAFKEAREKIARLPEVYETVFQDYVTYIYSGVIRVHKDDDDEELTEEYTDENDPGRHLRFHALVELYGLANYLQDLALKNTIIDTLFDPAHNIPAGINFASVRLAFKITPEHSHLCRLLVDVHLSGCISEALEKYWNVIPDAFIRALTIGEYHETLPFDVNIYADPSYLI